MGLLAFGINHRTASVALRERVAFAPDQLCQLLQDAAQQTGMTELAILSTCNRTEFYGVAESEQAEKLQQWLSKVCNVALSELAPVCYRHESADAVRHAMQVAAGLDSMILGEPQIFGQMKQAYSQAETAGTLGSELRRLFQTVFAAVKQVRTETSIGSSPVSIGFAAVNLARQVFASLDETPVLLIGAGEMNALVARHLREQGVSSLTVVNRGDERALQLAQEVGAITQPWSELATALESADMVVSCTGSVSPVVTVAMVQQAMKKRRHRPLLLIDIAVPRDIAPQVADLDDVFLYTVDDLQSVVDAGLRQRQAAAIEANQLIDARVNNFLQQQRIQQDASALIGQLRRDAMQLVEEERARAVEAIRAGLDAEQVLARLQHNMLNRWLHAPTMNLRQLAAEGDLEQLALASRVLGLTAKTSLDEEQI